MLSLLFWNSARPGAAPSPAPARNVKEFLPHVLRPTFHNHTHTYAHPTPTPPTALTRDIAAQIRASSDSGDRSRLLLCRCLQLCHCYQQYRIVFEPTSQSTFAE
nr:uncharacterized protein CTRU02_02685 [Colletotrichum truncatum]KAF6798711.1 hypothetical protein CTRU02_02685 [Colletotrichum truncatum]